MCKLGLGVGIGAPICGCVGVETGIGAPVCTVCGCAVVMVGAIGTTGVAGVVMGAVACIGAPGTATGTLPTTLPVVGSTRTCTATGFSRFIKRTMLTTTEARHKRT